VTQSVDGYIDLAGFDDVVVFTHVGETAPLFFEQPTGTAGAPEVLFPEFPIAPGDLLEVLIFQRSSGGPPKERSYILEFPGAAAVRGVAC